MLDLEILFRLALTYTLVILPKSMENKKSGKLIFSTEHTEKEGFHLEKSGRYSHSVSYIEGLCKKFNFTMSYFAETNLRKDNGVFLTGGLYLLHF